MASDDGARSRDGDHVGLGRVIHDDTRRKGARHEPDEVEEASNESFPASDAPAFAPGRAIDRDARDAGRPDPPDVP